MSSEPTRTDDASPGGSSLSQGLAPVASMSRLVDEMLDRYAEWREDAYGVTEAYARWCGATGRDEEWRFFVYMAALELEEGSANTYAAVVTQLDSRLRQAERRTGLTGERRAP